MSMLSSQCDTLRVAADALEDEGVIPDCAKLMRDAADTILELRDDLQQANEATRDAEHDESMAWDRVRKVERENAKLRELCLDAHQWMGRALYDGSARRHEYESITDRMRELGIEADE